MTKSITEDPIAITVYDIDKKQPIGVFKSCSIAGRYLFPLKDKGAISSKINDRAMRRSRMRNTTLGTVAIRYANDDQKIILKTGPRGLFHIYPGYPAMDEKKIVTA